MEKTGFFQRSAHIEFLSKNLLQITTPYKQKTFLIDQLLVDNSVIDLVKLDLEPRAILDPAPFHLDLTMEEDTGNISGEVWIRYNGDGDMRIADYLEPNISLTVRARIKES